MATRRLYSILGLLLLLAVLYLNWFPSPAAPGALKLPVPWLQPRMSFAGRDGTHFVDAATGAPLYVNGWNSYWLLSCGSQALVAEMLRRGRRMGLTVCRTWAFVDGGPGALQISPGRFSEAVFQVPADLPPPRYPSACITYSRCQDHIVHSAIVKQIIRSVNTRLVAQLYEVYAYVAV